MKTMIALVLVAMAVGVRGQTSDGIANTTGMSATGMNSTSNAIGMGNGTYMAATGMNSTSNATATADNSGSSLSVYPLINAQLVVLAPCAGLQIHTHDQTEYATADANNVNPLKMVYVNPTGDAVVVNVLPGETLVIPAGLLHYQINYGCSPSTFIGTFRRPAITELVLPSLAVMPDVFVYLNITGINGTAGNSNSMMANGTAGSMGGGMSATDNTGALANITAAVTNPSLFVVNPVCAQTCA
jgi:uncharacterized RmlC-like cupin family protein